MFSLTGTYLAGVFRLRETSARKESWVLCDLRQLSGKDRLKNIIRLYESQVHSQ